MIWIVTTLICRELERWWLTLDDEVEESRSLLARNFRRVEWAILKFLAAHVNSMLRLFNVKDNLTWQNSKFLLDDFFEWGGHLLLWVYPTFNIVRLDICRLSSSTACASCLFGNETRDYHLLAFGLSCEFWRCVLARFKHSHPTFISWEEILSWMRQCSSPRTICLAENCHSGYYFPHTVSAQ